MFELLYTSTATHQLSSDLELLGLLREARLKNDRLKITGMLLYRDGEVMQILEGEEKAVKMLYEEIARDKRHSNVEIFHQGSIHHRAFEGWAMGFRRLNETNINHYLPGYETLARIPKVLERNREVRNPGRKAFLSLFKSIFAEDIKNQPA